MKRSILTFDNLSLSFRLSSHRKPRQTQCLPPAKRRLFFVLTVERSSIAWRTLGAINVMRWQTIWTRAGNREHALSEPDQIFAAVPDQAAGRQLERELRGPR